MRLIIVGLGGIGTHLVPALFQYLNYEKEKTFDDIILVDGDKYEEHNSNRQLFSTFGNKAQVTAADASKKYPNLIVNYDDEYITKKNIENLIFDGDVVMLCVDNHATRLLVQERLEELGNLTVISGGNHMHDGNVMILQRKGGVNQTPTFTELHPEIGNGTSRNPGEMSCDELALLPSGNQVGLVNSAIANIMRMALYSLMNGKLAYYEVLTDCMTCETEAIGIPQKDALEYEYLSL